KAGLIAADMDKQLAEQLVTTRKSELAQLVLYVQQQRRDLFDAKILELGGERVYRDATWLLLAEYQSRRPTQSALVALCDPSPAKGTNADIACKPVPKKTPEKKKVDDSKG